MTIDDDDAVRKSDGMVVQGAIHKTHKNLHHLYRVTFIRNEPPIIILCIENRH